MGSDLAHPEEVADLQDRRDRAAMERVARRDADAFGELFRRYGPQALGLARRLVREPALAEEIVQDVFLAVWRKAHAYDPVRGSVRSWLLLQTHHRAVDVVRHEAAERRRASNHEPLGDEPTPDDVIEEGWIAARRRQVRTALRALPDEQRTAIELAYYRGMTQSEVAAAVGIPLGTVKSRTLAGMHKLHQALSGVEHA